MVGNAEAKVAETEESVRKTKQQQLDAEQEAEKAEKSVDEKQQRVDQVPPRGSCHLEPIGTAHRPPVRFLDTRFSILFGAGGRNTPSCAQAKRAVTALQGQLKAKLEASA